MSHMSHLHLLFFLLSALPNLFTQNLFHLARKLRMMETQGAQSGESAFAFSPWVLFSVTD